MQLTSRRNLAFWRRYRAFLLPWLLFAFWPPLRLLPWEHTDGFFQGSGPDIDASLPLTTLSFVDLVDVVWTPSSSPEDASEVSTPDLTAAEELTRRFPSVKWVPAMRLRAKMLSGEYISPPELDVARALAQSVRQLEPTNAFPIMCAALWQYQGNLWEQSMLEEQKRPRSPAAKLAQDAAVLQLLHLAAGCREYDEHTREVLQCRVRAREARAGLTLEQKINLGYGNFSNYHIGMAEFGLQYARYWRSQGQHRRAIGIAHDLARIGLLMLGPSNQAAGLDTASPYLQASADFFCAASLAASAPSFRPGRPGGSVVLPPTPTTMPNVPGRQDLAHGDQVAPCLAYAGTYQMIAAAQDMQRCWAAYDALVAWRNSPAGGLNALVNNDAHLLSLGFLRNAGLSVVIQIPPVLAFWCLTACLFRRVVPQLASRLDRTAVALVCAFISAAFAGLSWHILRTYSAPLHAAMPPNVSCYFAASVTMAEVAPVLFSWLICALLSWWRRRDLFAHQTEYRQEMGLFPSQALLLQNALVVAFCVLTAQALLASIGWVVAESHPVGSGTVVNLPARNPFTWQAMTWGDIALSALYISLAELVLAFVLWIVKWRWFTAPLGRPATHAALRWWKESMGAYLILLSWCYLSLAVINVPVRAKANRDFDRVLRVGEIGALYENWP